MSTRFFRYCAVPLVIVATALPSTGVARADEENPTVPASTDREEAVAAHKIRQRNWRLRFFGAIEGGSGVVVNSGGSHSGVSINGGGGVGVNFEYRTSPRMGFEIGAMAVGGYVRVGARSKRGWNSTGVAVDGYVPVTFALNFHPLKSPEIVDFYVGPLAAATILSGVGVGPGVAVESRVDLGLGGNIGVDIAFGRKSRWSFNSGLKYIRNISNDGLQRDGFDFDPLIFSLGFGFRF